MKKCGQTVKKIEIENTSKDNSFHPVIPGSVDILDYVKYEHPLDYMEMLKGKEIGLHKFKELYNQSQPKGTSEKKSHEEE